MNEGLCLVYEMLKGYQEKFSELADTQLELIEVSLSVQVLI